MWFFYFSKTWEILPCKICIKKIFLLNLIIGNSFGPKISHLLKDKESSKHDKFYFTNLINNLINWKIKILVNMDIFVLDLSAIFSLNSFPHAFHAQFFIEIIEISVLDWYIRIFCQIFLFFWWNFLWLIIGNRFHFDQLRYSIFHSYMWLPSLIKLIFN